MLAKKDLNGHTPLEVANNYKKSEASKMLYNAFSELTKKRLTDYLTSEIKDKEIISTADKERMENKVIEILYPLFCYRKG